MLRILIYLTLVFNMLVAIAAACVLLVGIRDSTWSVPSALGAAACLGGAAIIAILGYGFRKDRAQPLSGRTKTSVGSKPLPTVAELEVLRAAAQTAFDSQKADYDVVLAEWRACKDKDAADLTEDRQTTYKRYIAARERMADMRDEVIHVIKQLRAAEARLVLNAPGKTQKS